MSDQGLVFVYTGNGKGKTTAAIGLAVRAAGQGKRVVVIQFIKSPNHTYGEKVIFDKLGIEIYQMGIGFTWTDTEDNHREALRKAWAFTKEKIASGNYDLVVLDELNNALAIDRFKVDDVLPLDEVLDVIDSRPSFTHLVITGRNAKQELLDKADLITTMQADKHYYDKKIPAILGIEY